MPELGKCVVLLQDRDGGPGSAAVRVAAIRGLDVLVLALDAEARALEELGEADRRFALLIGDLGLRVQRARERIERVAALVDRLQRALVQRLRITHD